MKKLSYLLIAAVLGLGLMAFAGCGDDEESGSGGGSTTTEATSTPTEEPAGDATEEPTGDATEVPNDVAQEACESSLASAPTISEGDKGELTELCVKAATGDTQAAKDFCSGLVEASIPEGTPGSAKEQALKACEDSIPQG